MALFISLMIVLGVIIGVAAFFDLRARRHRALANDFDEAGRLAARGVAHDRDAKDARSRPNHTGSRMNLGGGGGAGGG